MAEGRRNRVVVRPAHLPKTFLSLKITALPPVVSASAAVLLGVAFAHAVRLSNAAWIEEDNTNRGRRPRTESEEQRIREIGIAGLELLSLLRRFTPASGRSHRPRAGALEFSAGVSRSYPMTSVSGRRRKASTRCLPMKPFDPVTRMSLGKMPGERLRAET